MPKVGIQLRQCGERSRSRTNPLLKHLYHYLEDTHTGKHCGNRELLDAKFSATAKTVTRYASYAIIAERLHVPAAANTPPSKICMAEMAHTDTPCINHSVINERTHLPAALYIHRSARARAIFFTAAYV